MTQGPPDRFEYDLAPDIEALTPPASATVEAVERGSPDASQRLAYWLVCACGAPVLAECGVRVSPEAGGVDWRRPGPFCELLREAGAVPEGSWLEMPAEAAAGQYLAALGEADGFATAQLLGGALAVLRDSGAGKLPDFARRAIAVLMGRFEIFGRVFDAYDQAMRRVGRDFCQLPVYALLALDLLLLFEQDNRLDCLNGALKIADMFREMRARLDSPLSATCGFAAIATARAMVGEFHDRQGHRVPS